MARIDDLEKRLDGRIGALTTALWTVLVIILGWLGVGTSYLFSMHGDIQAIKQYEKDHGGEIVKNIEHPTSDESLAANLSLAAAQLQVARAEHRQPDAGRLRILQGALSSAVQQHPSVPEVWQAAVQLVDYKDGAARQPEHPRNCLDTIPPDGLEVDRITTSDGAQEDFPNFSGPQTTGWMSHVMLGHCSLSLDDDGNFSQTSLGKFFIRVRQHHPQASLFYLVLDEVDVSYSGGKMIPISGIQYSNCTFQLTPPMALPNARSRALTAQLLASTLPTGTVNLPSV